MINFETERLRELLLDLERSRQKEEFERKTAEALINGLRIISSYSSRDELFLNLFKLMKTMIQFDECYLMREVTGHNIGERELVSIYPYFKKSVKLSPKLCSHKSESPICVFNNNDQQYSFLTGDDSSSAGSTLIIPLNTTTTKYWVFMFSREQSAFTHQHVTIAKKLKELLKQAIQKDDFTVKLIQADKLRALGEMAGGIAHEINNPLAIIQGNVEILKRILPPEEAKKYLPHIESIDRTTKRISQIINGLKVISRGEVNTDSKIEVTLSQVLEDAFSVCSEKFRIAGIDVTIEIAKEHIEQKYFLNRTLLAQVFLNLLTNAFDAIKKLDKKWLKIQVSVSKKEIHFLFIDSGSGISAKDLNKIFQPFYTTKDIGEGTGLGLSICKSIIESLGGKISIDHDYSNTCFHITIPT